MAALSIGIATTTINFRSSRAPISSRPRISCIGWDPEGVLGPPQTGHIARREFKKRLEKDSEAREAFERQVREEKERRRAIRQSRVIPDTPDELVEYFLNTEAQEFEVEIARLRTRLVVVDLLAASSLNDSNIISSCWQCKLSNKFLSGAMPF